ncbi:type I DNA topoisomerase [Candidatus Dojkabacteria bacterium]|nr:type I DNA topoisomerase [Candidatus Dojkabacteria bacterium]
MAKSLVIVESPSKERYIKRYLGKNYQVKASKGHIVDLPKKEIGVDTEKKYKPKYTVTNRKALSALKKEFQDADELVLAVDPDREGEAIGWHVAQKLGVVTERGRVKKGKALKRIVFSEITEDAVKAAMEKPRSIDMDLVDAQQTRRILDRLVGYKLSPLLWKKVRYGLSAGRVQSVALKLVVEKERERDAFKPDEFWKVDADLNDKKSEQIGEKIYKKDDEVKEDLENYFSLTKKDSKKYKPQNEKEIKTILEKLKKEEWLVSDVDTSLKKRNPSPPFKTSTLQQGASNRYGFTASRTMRAAQKLYEKGLITYMRTDSISLSSKAIKAIRKYIESAHTKKYLPEKQRLYKTKQKVAQEAHEAIRPTNISNSSKQLKLTGDEAKLYDLIRGRTLASQAESAKVETQKVIVEVANFEFELSGERVVFDGFFKFNRRKIKEKDMPVYEKGQELFPKQIVSIQKFTQPPARYSEATLIKQLEKYGVGRPSTYAPIISTITSRGYVEKVEKYLKPTDTGIIVTRLLEDHFPKIVDYNFTAELEAKLDNIANGELDWVETIDDFYRPFEKNLEKKVDEIDREDYNILGEAPKSVKCPDCKSPMLIKLGKYGRFYSCSKWPDCKGITAIEDKEAEKIDTGSKDFLEKYKPAPKTEDGRDYLFKKGRYGYFWAHPDYPKKKDIKSLEYTKDIFKKVYGKPPKGKDGKTMVLRKGRFGEFWSHPDYPKVKEYKSIKKKELAKKKEEFDLL